MTIVVVLVGAVIAGIGIVGLVHPARLIAWLSSFWKRDRLWFAVVLRLVVGALLVYAAPECRWPQVVRVLGLITLISGGGLVVFGRERMRAFVAWWTDRPPLIIRACSAAAAAFGALLIYAGT